MIFNHTYCNIIVNHKSQQGGARQNTALASVTLVVAAIAILSVAYGSDAAVAAAGLYVDTVTITKQENTTLAAQSIMNGNMDLYYLSVPGETAQVLRDDGHQIYEAAGGTIYALYVNPTDDYREQFNPFSIREVRLALNHVLDRNSIVSDIIGSGYAMYSGLYSHHPDYPIVHRHLEQFEYDLHAADAVFVEALEPAGAAKNADGMWHYDGAPIKIIIFIRDDDPIRHAIGERIAADLELLGFAVDRKYGDLLLALETVYYADPADQGWHVYTGAWGSSVSSPYDDTILAQHYAPWSEFLPGGLVPDFWNYEHERLDTLTRLLHDEQYDSVEQRAKWVLEATQLGVSEAVRIFFAADRSVHPARDGVVGVVNSLGDGIANRYTAINAQPPDSDSNLDIGVRHITQGSWNPANGFVDSYSAAVWSMLHDTAFVRNPHTLDLQSGRNVLASAHTDGPVLIPEGSIMWDADANMWSAPASTHAKSVITIDLELGEWHHGPLVDINDILYLIVFREENRMETYIQPLLFANHVAVEIVDSDTIKVYLDYAHSIDGDATVEAAGLWPVIPWEVHHAMDVAVRSGDTHWSIGVAESLGVSWLDMIDYNDTATIRAYIDERRDASHVDHIPDFLYENRTSEYVSDRYDAAVSWMDAMGHMAISNGPFYLSGDIQSDGDTVTQVILERFDGQYPFEAGRWSSFADFEPLTGDVTIGSLASESGNAERYGKEIRAAYDLAISDFNEYLEARGQDWRLATVSLDTQTNPTVIFDHLTLLNERGINLAVGPAIDLFDDATMEYANQNDMTLVSCCSSGPSLAIPDDALYRMIPDQRVHADAIVDMMTGGMMMYGDNQDNQITHIIPVGVPVDWASELLEATKEKFEARGHTSADIIYYDADANTDSMRAAASELASSVMAAVAQKGSYDAVAVVYIGFGEGPEFLKLAAQYDALYDVRWFGADQNTAMPNIADDSISAAFADDVGLVVVQPGLPTGDAIHDTINADIRGHLASLNIEPSPYSSYAYDAVWIMGLSILNAQSTESADVRAQITPTAMRHVGAVGPITLNENGDSTDAPYAAWMVSGEQWVPYEQTPTTTPTVTPEDVAPARICR